MEQLIPIALVLGCNTPVGINPLSDWIEEQTGHPPDFQQAGWSDGLSCNYGGGYTRSDGDSYSENGWGYGDGVGYGNWRGNGCGYGISAGVSYVNIDDGSGNRTWFTVHDGNGYGVGYGNANGDGCGNGFD